jgi:predicted ATPase
MIDINKELSDLTVLIGKFSKVYPGYISHIRFPRYKNMALNARIDFSFPVTALVGANGSGKTSVLNALYGAPLGNSTGQYWFSTKVDPIDEGEGSPNRYIYGHHSSELRELVETRKARVRKVRNGRPDANYWEPTKESTGDDMKVPILPTGKKIKGRSLDRWNPVRRKVLYINFRQELSAFDKYFYFGKEPVSQPGMVQQKTTSDGKKLKVSSQRIFNKRDQVRNDALLLSRVIEADDTNQIHRGRKIATENRLLDKAELDAVKFILGRDYEQARWIRHRLFKVDGGVSVLFKTRHGAYSEAFAGSGEVAVTSCVVQLLKATKGTLVLLDEPEVSLHPGAQERLLAFFLRVAKRNQLQVIFSTHSPHLVSSLPPEAIKVFNENSDGKFAVSPASHPYAAFVRLGATPGGQVLVLVEDRLAKSVVERAIATIVNDDVRKLFRVEFLPGGAQSILNNRIPVFMESSDTVYVLLDGDQKKVDQFRDQSDIPEADNAKLLNIIFSDVGAKPTILVDGGSNGTNADQAIAARRLYLDWVKKNLSYIPTSSPEELVLLAAGLQLEVTGNDWKGLLHERASMNLGKKASSEEADFFGAFILGLNVDKSNELKALAKQLTDYIDNLDY